MDSEAIKTKKCSWKKAVIILLAVFLLLLIAVGGFFGYKYLFPTDKELFIIAHKNLFTQETNQDQPEKFYTQKEISLSADGDFTGPKAAKAFSTVKILTENYKMSADNTEYNMAINFLGNDILNTSSVKSGATEVMYVPQLSGKRYASDSYEDVLSVLLGSKKAENKEITEGIDKEKAREYLTKYFKNIYETIPESDFSSVKDGENTTLTLKTDFNRAVFNTVSEIKEDAIFRDFFYEQTSIIKANINKRYPYIGTLLEVADKNEYYEDYEKELETFIKNIENAQLLITIKLDKHRNILTEEVAVTDEDKPLYLLSYDKNNFYYAGYENDALMLNIHTTSATIGTVTDKTWKYTFDINEYTKEKSDKQKMVTIDIVSRTDTSVEKNIVLPEEYVDIRSMSNEEKEKITQEASSSFMELLATLAMELLS